MTLFSRRSDRTPTYTLETASHEQLNAGSSYRIRFDRGTLSLSARKERGRVYYYVTKRVRGRLHKIYAGKCGEITPARIRAAGWLLLAEIAAHAATRHEKGVGGMRARQRGVDETLVLDLIAALDVVVQAPLEERQALYAAWQENTSRTLALVLSPQEQAAWEPFSTQEVDWTSESGAALYLRSVRAFLRALASASRGREHPRPRRGGLHRFTRHARQVLTLAQAEAQRLHHDRIGTEHLLLGLAQVEQGHSREILGRLGVRAGEVRAAIEETAGSAAAPVARNRISLSRDVKHVLERAVNEARERGHPYIDTTHLLLALAQEEGGGAAGVLRRLGVPPERVYEETAREISHPRDREKGGDDL